MPQFNPSDSHIVDTTYAEGEGRGGYREVLEAARGEGECPFCPANLSKYGNDVVREVGRWVAIRNRWPYPHAAVHLLLLPLEHIVDISGVLTSDWQDVQGLIVVLRRDYPTLQVGGALAVRFGTNSGATVRHLHFHLIAPVTNSETGKPHPGEHVSFPIG
ncbi:MAG: HIT domain-containing protein [Candidatus Wildermuthbacteria bacterium]|nr:HIT domain-containing protein [Candidatus Wildermuthbacteria bacterium]